MDRNFAKGLKKYRDIFKESRDKDMNEADCVTRIIKFLEEVLEYDVLQEITKEFQVKDRYVDLAVKIDGKIKFYIEAKSAGTRLKESQIYQAESYASQSGIPWVVLTNGCEWQLYHLVFDKTGIDHSLIFSVNIVDDDGDDVAHKLAYLSRASMRKNEIEDYWQKHSSLKSDSIVRALFHEDTINSIKREIRRRANVTVDEDDIVEGLKGILSNDILTAHGEAIKIRRRKKSKEKTTESAPIELTVQDSSPNQPIISPGSPPIDQTLDKAA